MSARRLREEVFGHELFSDPAWDILLDVFTAGSRGVKVQISSLAPMSRLPPSTARRWAHRLIERDLLERECDAHDNRLVYVRLSATGHAHVQRFIERLMGLGPPPPITF